MTAGNGARPAASSRADERTATRCRAGGAGRPGRLEDHPRREAGRRSARRRPEQGPRQRPRGPHRQGGRAGRRQRRHGCSGRRRHAHQGRLGDARALHGRVALGPDRDLVPHAHGHDARHAPQAAQGGRPQGLVHPPDRLRDRARGDRADAGHDAPLRRDRRQAARDRRRRRQPRHRRRRRAQGRRPHADGAGDPRRRPAVVPGVPRRVRRADRQGAREQARRRRPPGRQPVAHQPGRHRHDRLGPAADEGPGHADRHRLDRVPAGARRTSAR